jgi:EpsI family protein
MDKANFSRYTRNGLFVAVSLILILQAGASHMLGIDERKVPIPQLHSVPFEFGKWKANGEGALPDSIVSYLQPDDYILRDYSSGPDDAGVNLFVAHFNSLQKTYGPHAPRICLPGSGWLERSSKVASIEVPGSVRAIPVNELTYEKGDQRILVFYWYQNSRNIWAEEFRAKLTLLPDLIRYRSSDVSLVRLILPLRALTPDTELASGLEFTRLIFPTLVERFGTSN